MLLPSSINNSSSSRNSSFWHIQWPFPAQWIVRQSPGRFPAGVTNKRTTTIPASIYGVGWRTLVLDFPVFKYDEKRIDPIQGQFQFSHNFPSPCAGNCFQNDGHTAIVCLWYRRDRENPFGASLRELQCCQNTNFHDQCERNRKKTILPERYPQTMHTFVWRHLHELWTFSVASGAWPAALPFHDEKNASCAAYHMWPLLHARLLFRCSAVRVND